MIQYFETKSFGLLGVCALAVFAGHYGVSNAAGADAPTITMSKDSAATPTESLSDDDWRSMSREDRKQRMRRSMIARYEPTGIPSVEKLGQYVDKFAEFTVYDRRYYLYDVEATHVAGTTGTVVLSGEVSPANYRTGIQEALESLGFIVSENNIQELPTTDAGYGVSTTYAATLRKEPRRRAEQMDSVAMGGSVRFLRDAEESDLSSASQTRSRHAPGADALPEDTPADWALAQSMGGYIGYVRKADFKMSDTYALPDGVLKQPVVLKNKAELPAGIFVFGSPDAGWRLESGEELPADAAVSDIRPGFTADEILTLSKPFMDTGYVWGGTTDQGIDCSGFSQFFLRTNGVQIPRDAVQQATGGVIVAWGPDEVKKHAKPGDLLFFVSENGRVSHVAISLGGKRIIHSAGEGVHITMLDEPDNNEQDKEYGDNVLFARRMFTGR